MSNELDDVVRVVIFDQSTAITTASFQIPLILGTFSNFPERARVYNNLQAVGGDFNSTDTVYKMAEKVFGQSGVLGAPPPSVVIGRRLVTDVTLVPQVADEALYTVTINGEDYTYESGVGATDLEISEGITDALSLVSGITVVDAAGSIVISSTEDWSYSVSGNIIVEDEATTESIVEALEAVEQVNNNWYCVVSDTRDPAEQEALSDAIQGREKIYGLSTSDPQAITANQTDIGAKLNAKSAARTFGVYLPTADTEYPEAAWVGSQLAVTPGQNDWDFKRANGVTVSRLSATAIANLKDKNYNYYHAKGGVNIFQNGDMFNGAPIDIQIGKDWLTARIQEAVYFRMINMLKIPMTDAGLLIIENEIRSVLAQAESNTLIDGGWSVSTPPVLSIPETMRAQRAAGVFVIRARLAGAIRFVDIEIYLSV